MASALDFIFKKRLARHLSGCLAECHNPEVEAEETNVLVLSNWSALLTLRQRWTPAFQTITNRKKCLQSTFKDSFPLFLMYLFILPSACFSALFRSAASKEAITFSRIEPNISSLCSHRRVPRLQAQKQFLLGSQHQSFLIHVILILEVLSLLKCSRAELIWVLIFQFLILCVVVVFFPASYLFYSECNCRLCVYYFCCFIVRISHNKTQRGWFYRLGHFHCRLTKVLTCKSCTRLGVLSGGHCHSFSQSFRSTARCHSRWRWPTKMAGWSGWCSVEVKRRPRGKKPQNFTFK